MPSFLDESSCYPAPPRSLRDLNLVQEDGRSAVDPRHDASEQKSVQFARDKDDVPGIGDERLGGLQRRDALLEPPAELPKLLAVAGPEPADHVTGTEKPSAVGCSAVPLSSIRLIEPIGRITSAGVPSAGCGRMVTNP